MTRKVLTRISACILSLCLAAASVVSMPAAKASAASQPVQLKYAHYWLFPVYGSDYNNDMEIDVQKLGTDKQVTIHFTTDGTNWSDDIATYVKDDPNNSGYEIWSFKGVSTVAMKSFAVKYVVNGTTYWDNNNGNDYTFTQYNSNVNDGIVLGNDTVKYIPYNGYDMGGIFVKNLGYAKTVNVRYSTDNWATYTDIAASYDSSPSSSIDEFSMPVIPVGAQFAISYTTNGTTYWDNNNGSNYTI